MHRINQRLAGAALLMTCLTGCASLPPGTPRTMGAVADGTPVGYRLSPRAEATRGVAAGWSRGVAGVVRAAGDTVLAPDSAQLEIRIPPRKKHGIAGAVVGWAIAVATMYATCPTKRYCGEENPLPLLGTGLGWLVGDHVKTDWWVVVPRE